MTRGTVQAAALLGAMLLCMSAAIRVDAATVLIDSFETQVPWGVYQNTFTPGGFSNTTGVTDGSFSFIINGAGPNGPDYSSMTGSATTMAITNLLANSASVSLDVFTPPASFGFFQQWSCAVNNNDTGFQSLDGYSYSQSPVIGTESTLTWTIPAGIRSTLATSTNATQIVFLVGGGYSAGNETMYLDNLRATPLVVPEPASMSLLLVGAGAMLLRRRAR